MYIKAVSFFISIFFPLIAFTQTNDVKQLSPFTSVNVTKSGKVVITQGDTYSIRTEPTGEADNVKATVEGKTLSISIEPLPSKGTTIYITMKEIEELSVSGLGDIVSELPIKSENLNLNIGGLGKIQLTQLDLKKLSANISGGGKVTLGGRAETIDINIPGAGIVEAESLKTVNGNINISGSGRSEVDVTDNLDINISGSGRVFYLSPPKNISKHISGLGKVREGSAGSSSKNNNDTTSLRLGKRTLTISGSSDNSTTNNDDEEKDEDNNNDRDKSYYNDWGHEWEKWGDSWGDKWKDRFPFDEKKKKKNAESNKPSWQGIELGINGYMNADNSTTLPANVNYLDLNYGKSVSFSLNFFEVHKKFFHRHLFLFTGLGVTWNNYRFSNNITLKPSSTSLLASNDSISYEKNKLTASYLVAPAMIEAFFGHNRYRSFHVAGGLMLGYKLGSHTKQKYESEGQTVKTKVYDDFNLDPFRASVRVSAGYGRVNIFAEQALTTLFQKDKGPVLYPFTVGIGISSF